MNLKIVKTSLIFMALGAISSPAQLLNFDFSISNTTGNVPGTITGEIIGLQNNATSAPSDIIFTSIPAALGITSPPDYSLASNGWFQSGGLTVNNGIVTGSSYFASNPGSSSTFGMTSATNTFSSPGNQVLNNNGGIAGAHYTLQAVPEPGCFELGLASGVLLVCLGIHYTRKTANPA